MSSVSSVSPGIIDTWTMRSQISPATPKLLKTIAYPERIFQCVKGIMEVRWSPYRLTFTRVEGTKIN